MSNDPPQLPKLVADSTVLLARLHDQRDKLQIAIDCLRFARSSLASGDARGLRTAMNGAGGIISQVQTSLLDLRTEIENALAEDAYARKEQP